MTAAPRIAVAAPVAARAPLSGDALRRHRRRPRGLRGGAGAAAGLPGPQDLGRWRALADAGDLAALAADLVGNHYDPAYDRSNRKDPRPRLATLEMPGLEGVDQEAAADAIVDLLAQPRVSSGASAAQSRSAPAGKS